MKLDLQYISIPSYISYRGRDLSLRLSYEIVGCTLFTAPIVLINHPLTANSHVTGQGGWWSEIVGAGKIIDTNFYTVLCFNVPGNGFDGFVFDDSKELIAKDVAKIFLRGLDALGIESLHSIVAGSMGGAISWEMLKYRPSIAQFFIPIATDWKTSDWLASQCLIQNYLLESTEGALEKARAHAMLLYRTPQSLNIRFQNKKNENKKRESLDWLDFHGKRLSSRFSLQAYKTVNHILSSIQTVNPDEDSYKKLASIKAEIIMVSIDTDMLFPFFENEKSYQEMKKHKQDIEHIVINSEHGHDAFLMEYEQIANILKKIYKSEKMKEDKNILVFDGKALLVFEGKDFSGQIGIDSRVFKALGDAKISVGIISQEATEKGMSLLVDEKHAEKGRSVLINEFQEEILNKEVERIYTVNDLSVVSVSGLKSQEHNKPFQALVRNHVFPLLVSNNVAEHKVNFLIKSPEKQKALSIIRNILHEAPKLVHLVIFGAGQVGSTLVEQIQQRAKELREKRKLDLRIVAIANSKKVAFQAQGFGASWETELRISTHPSKVEHVLGWIESQHLENLIFVDNTASKELVTSYFDFARAGFDLVSSNKVFNTLGFGEYQKLRDILKEKNKKYLYETNVGAGLPLIDTIKLLHLSGDSITRIKGVFSGSLSYIFNNFSLRDVSFSEVIKEAMELGYTEPDPREDLSGNDVARKLLILARELELTNELEDISLENLIPKQLQNVSKEEFLNRLEELDSYYKEKKDKMPEGYVMRYIGDLHGDLYQEKGILDVKLSFVPKTASLGQVKGSDSIFEIYTQSYDENPIVIMGAGAGAKVTARGVFGDILRLSENK